MKGTEFDPLNIRAQEKAAQDEANSLKLERERELEDLKYLMAIPQARRFVWRLLEKSGVFRSSFSLNGLEMSFREGNRNFGVAVLAEIHEHCPDRYVQMMKEQRQAHGHRSGKRQTN